MKDKSLEYRRNLPHIQPFDGCFFITYRLYGSLPKFVINNYLDELELIKKKPYSSKLSANLFLELLDDYLDNNSKIDYLKDEKLAEEARNSIRFYDEKYYELICYTIMSNHVHVIVNCNGYKDINLSILFGRIKGFSAYKCNIIRNKKGSHFWAQESYDHLIVDNNELDFYINYVINNPVSANIVSEWQDYKFTYLKDKYIDKGVMW